MSSIPPAPFTTRVEIDGTFGVATSTHWIATAVAISILERGGNAFDAGIAAAFTLQVVEPHLCGPGGDVPVMVCRAAWITASNASTRAFVAASMPSPNSTTTALSPASRHRTEPAGNPPEDVISIPQ